MDGEEAVGWVPPSARGSGAGGGVSLNIEEDITMHFSTLRRKSLEGVLTTKEL